MRGLNPENLSAILDFLYRGETNVLQENLDAFLALAEELKLKGLTRGGAEAERDPDKKLPQDGSFPVKKEKRLFMEKIMPWSWASFYSRCI